ncbi:unnamed protein product [Cuscuta campestris]|uniref:PXA domain-containing protein n=1 Tax=Cuscuta campestris TaxID=132261 RepID=A0A484MSZ8_9ASTE|nr:unnamed protein product [Cuscuta campestris]
MARLSSPNFLFLVVILLVSYNQTRVLVHSEAKHLCDKTENGGCSISRPGTECEADCKRKGFDTYQCTFPIQFISPGWTCWCHRWCDDQNDHHHNKDYNTVMNQQPAHLHISQVGGGGGANCGDL